MKRVGVCLWAVLKKIEALLLILILITIGNFGIQQVSAVDYDAEIRKKEDEKIEKQGELEESEQLEYAYQQEGLSISQTLVALDADLQNLEENIAGVEGTVAEVEADLAQTETEKLETSTSMYNFSRSLYKVSRVSLVEILFSVDGISDLIQQIGFRKFTVTHLVGEIDILQGELAEITVRYDELSIELDGLQGDLTTMNEDRVILGNQKAMYAQMAIAEAERQSQLVGAIANITAEQEALIREKMAATQQDTSIGEYEDVSVDLPAAPFSPAFAVASIGYPHRVGLSQYGAYGRSKVGQTYGEILSAYYNADLIDNYAIPDQICVMNYHCTAYDLNGNCTNWLSGWMDFEGQYMKGIAEMPTSWGDSGGYEALKAQAVIARTYAINSTSNGVAPICATEFCQVYNHVKATGGTAVKWYSAVEDTRGEVLTQNGGLIGTYYASTAGGYTRLPSDFDVRWNSTSPAYLKRVVDFAGDGKAFDGPGYGNSPWYYKVWYASSDIHPWLTEAEMKDLLNAALLPETYNSHLSHPDLGGWSYEQVVGELNNLGIVCVSDISSISVMNSGDGYTSSLQVVTSSGVVGVDGIRFWQVFKLRSRGYLALWSSLYDIVKI